MGSDDYGRPLLTSVAPPAAPLGSRPIPQLCASAYLGYSGRSSVQPYARSRALKARPERFSRKTNHGYVSCLGRRICPDATNASWRSSFVGAASISRIGDGLRGYDRFRLDDRCKRRPSKLRHHKAQRNSCPRSGSMRGADQERPI